MRSKPRYFISDADSDADADTDDDVDNDNDADDCADDDADLLYLMVFLMVLLMLRLLISMMLMKQHPPECTHPLGLDNMLLLIKMTYGTTYCLSGLFSISYIG